ncbi:DMT family transporter [Maribacter sp. HTCC2170]|uniref:DMT family transporter n=1 Tax=Maribacter sp. (strain HTCC2170 / KCCM 42371) TaxID=313603 RepID=UPI00006B3AED|nr:EamA family transporter [Maribacter sp. HTCC2170]EAQ99783.1 predicted permease [Maribacter sp. HTCC2170]
MNEYNRKWIYLIILSIVWGSSFILIKKALLGFSALQLGSLRIVFASTLLLIIGYRSLKSISIRDWKWILMAGLLSSFFPPFLFALAQTQLDSGVTSIFNSAVPLFTTIVGIILFGAIITKRQIAGVLIGLFGTLSLILAGMEFNPDKNYWYSIFILLSALGYALNINIIKKHLGHLSPLAVTTGSFAVAFIPAIVIVVYSGVFSQIGEDLQMQNSLWYLLALAFLGTAVANIYFNKLIHLSSPVFAASVTYTIPIVAVLWGVWDGETINLYQLIGGGIILFGVYLVNRKKRPSV